MLVYLYMTTQRLTATLTDIDGDPVIGAAVTATVVNREGVPIVGQAWPLVLDDQDDGDYVGTVSYSWTVEVLQMVLVQITAVKDTEHAYAEIETQVQVDRA